MMAPESPPEQNNSPARVLSGARGTRHDLHLSDPATCEPWYIVASIEPTYEVAAVAFPDGRVIVSSPQAMDTTCPRHQTIPKKTS